MTETLLAVTDLAVGYRSRRGEVDALAGVSLRVRAGEVTALVGESGSGKTTLGQSVIGLLPAGGRITAGSIRLQGRELVGLAERRFRALRGARIGLVPQDPSGSLNPLRTVGASIAESLQVHGFRDRGVIRRRVIELLERVDIDDAPTRARQYPHELSGGMKQRVLIAAALALAPELVIADEPTSALDVTVQKTVLDLLDRLRRESGTGVLFITHDLAVAADRADEVVVLKDGRVQEHGPARRVLTAPASAYTRALLDDAPSLARVAPRPAAPTPAGAGAGAGAPIVVARDLRREFARPGGREPFTAVAGFSARVTAGTTHALVGESGSGKTTIGRLIAGFDTPTAGSVTVDGVDVAALMTAGRRAYRRVTQLVYQNPFASLDPRQRIVDIVAEPLRNAGGDSARARRDRALDQLAQVSLAPDLAHRLPRELSGGQRQRVAIARALILEPRLVVLDEAVSALDVTVQAQILRLLARLQRERGLTYVFISHDLAVVRQIADTVSVLHRGVTVESGAVEQVFTRPAADYTRRLLAAIPGAGFRAETPAPSPHPQEARR